MILLIDHDPSFAGDLATLLRPHSDFVQAGRSDVGLRMIADERPAQILLDLNMPHHLAMLDEEGGLEVLRRLYPQERARVVIVTGGLSSMVRRQLEALGVVRIYIKSEPVTRLRALMGGTRQLSLRGPEGAITPPRRCSNSLREHPPQHLHRMPAPARCRRWTQRRAIAPLRSMY